MKRVLPYLVLFALLAIAAPAAAQETPDECTGNVTNETIDSLCDRVSDLEDTKSDLEADKTSLRGQVEKLQYDLDHSESIQSLTEDMGFIYEDDNPQVLYLRLKKADAQDPNEKFGLFQKCDPGAMGKGGYDFDNDGEKEYCEVPISQTNDNPLSPIKVELYYAEPGMNTTYVLDQSNAQSRIEGIQDQLNDQGGVAAYDQWKTQKLYSASDQSFFSSIGIFGMGSIVGGIGLVAAVPVVRKVRERRRVNKSHRTGARSNGQSVTDRIKRFIKKFRR